MRWTNLACQGAKAYIRIEVPPQRRHDRHLSEVRLGGAMERRIWARRGVLRTSTTPRSLAAAMVSSRGAVTQRQEAVHPKPGRTSPRFQREPIAWPGAVHNTTGAMHRGWLCVGWRPSPATRMRLAAGVLQACARQTDGQLLPPTPRRSVA
jgi:hypothetical protein